MTIIEIQDISIPELAVYASLTEAQLRQLHSDDNSSGLFVAESPKVIRTALSAGYKPVSILCERRHIDGDAADIIAAADVPVYTGSREILSSLTGYILTRGVLCAMQRKPLPDMETVCKNASTIAVLDSVVDSTNIGAIFRSAAALGVEAVLLTPGCCEPYNRRVVRVSMGTVFQVPWTIISTPIVPTLKNMGFSTAAMALRDDSVDIDNPELNNEARLAIIMGSEGEGLPSKVIDEAGYTVCIPMQNGVDSLNVAAASSVAFWQLTRRNRHHPAALR